MKIIISPAKKMRQNTDLFDYDQLPAFIDQTEILCKKLQSMSSEELKKLWKCNDKIALQNIQRLEQMDLYKNLTPAIFAYEGIQYQYMAPEVFSDKEYTYIQETLRILSGFYGILRPFDGVTPYRLEMQSKLITDQAKDLYDFWKDTLAKELFKDDCIINLASKEYSICISKYLKQTDKSISFISCVFGEETDGKVIEKGTMCKMARGAMVRYMAENTIGDVEQIKNFSQLGYQFNEEYSTDETYVFLKKSNI